MGKGLGTEDDVYNFYHSQLRITVERAFGQLVGRWGILWKPLKFNLHFCVSIILVCIRLHNYCIDRGCTDGFDGDNVSPTVDTSTSNQAQAFLDNRGVLQPATRWRPDQSVASRRLDDMVAGTRRQQHVRDVISGMGLVRPARQSNSVEYE